MNAPLRPCCKPGCANLVANGYCNSHQKAVVDNRPTASQRGYGARWQKWRKWYLINNPMCVDCSIKPASEVHHIKKLTDYPELQYVNNNVMALCKSCHSIRTRAGE
jgi:5-methylcytosine-specific restriction protein A